MLARIKKKLVISNHLHIVAGLAGGVIFLRYFSVPAYALLNFKVQTPWSEMPAVQLPWSIGSILTVLWAYFLPATLSGILVRFIWKTKGWVAGLSLYIVNMCIYFLLYLFTPKTFRIGDYIGSYSILPFDFQKIGINFALLGGTILGGELAQALEGTRLIKFFFALTLQLICFYLFLWRIPQLICFHLLPWRVYSEKCINVISYSLAVFLGMLAEGLWPTFGLLSYISMVNCYFWGIFVPWQLRHIYNPLQPILYLIITYSFAGIGGGIVISGIRFWLKRRKSAPINNDKPACQKDQK